MGRWTSLATNRFIARADVQNGIDGVHLTPIGGAPGTINEQFVTRAELEAWINCTGVGASNQWQYKSGISCPPPTLYSHTIYASGYSYPYYTGWDTEALACSGTRSYPVTVYSTSSTLGPGSELFLFDGTDYYWFNLPYSTNKWVYHSTQGPVQMYQDYNEVVIIGNCNTSIIFNDYSTDLVITDIKVNGVTITLTNGTFPVYGLASITGYTTYSGTVNLEIYYNSNSGGQSISYTDSSSTLYCHNASSSGGNSLDSPNFSAGATIVINTSSTTC